jgi:hypothetical protein
MLEPSFPYSLTEDYPWISKVNTSLQGKEWSEIVGRTPTYQGRSTVVSRHVRILRPQQMYSVQQPVGRIAGCFELFRETTRFLALLGWSNSTLIALCRVLFNFPAGGFTYFLVFRSIPSTGSVILQLSIRGWGFCALRGRTVVGVFASFFMRAGKMPTRKSGERMKRGRLIKSHKKRGESRKLAEAL